MVRVGSGKKHVKEENFHDSDSTPTASVPDEEEGEANSKQCQRMRSSSVKRYKLVPRGSVAATTAPDKDDQKPSGRSSGRLAPQAKWQGKRMPSRSRAPARKREKEVPTPEALYARTKKMKPVELKPRPSSPERGSAVGLGRMRDVVAEPVDRRHMV